nr:hypothetical protein Iba_chr08dCG3940 [Ipomoea batatas]
MILPEDAHYCSPHSTLQLHSTISRITTAAKEFCRGHWNNECVPEHSNRIALHGFQTRALPLTRSRAQPLISGWIVALDLQVGLNSFLQSCHLRLFTMHKDNMLGGEKFHKIHNSLGISMWAERQLMDLSYTSEG